MIFRPRIQMPQTRPARLYAEFLLLYLAAPLIMALALPPSWMFPMLFAITAAGLGLLVTTPGFDARDLLRNATRIDGRLVGAFLLATAAVSFAIVTWTHPDALFALPRQRPRMMLMIALLYPVISALPQELVFRALFFRRYAPILPAGRAALLLNAGVFSFAHLMYWSWTVTALTFAAGLVFAHAYEVRRNFPMAVVLHALAGVVLFAFGMGAYFYSGNVTRPF